MPTPKNKKAPKPEKIGRYSLGVYECPAGHTVLCSAGSKTVSQPFSALMFDTPGGGGTRITRSKCCGSWRCKRSYFMSASDWRELAEMAERAAQQEDDREAQAQEDQ